MPHASPGHIRDVQQSIDAAEVDECPVVGDVLDCPLNQLAFLQRGQGRLTATIARLFQQHAPGHDHVAATMVDLDDLEGKGLSDQAVEIANRMQIDLRAGQERFDADIDHHAALDTGNDFTLNAFFVFVELLQFLPDFHLVGFFFGKHQIAVGIFTFFEIHLKPIAHLQLRQFLMGELVGWDHALRLVADIDHHLVFADGDDHAFSDGAFLKITEGLLIHRRQGIAVKFGFALGCGSTHENILVLRLAPGADCEKRPRLTQRCKTGLLVWLQHHGVCRLGPDHPPESEPVRVPQFWPSPSD